MTLLTAVSETGLGIRTCCLVSLKVRLGCLKRIAKIHSFFDSFQTLAVSMMGCPVVVALNGEADERHEIFTVISKMLEM